MIVIALFGVDHYLNQRKINDLLVQNKALDQNLKMSLQITPSRQIIYKTRTLTGEVKTVIKYLPPEGSAEVTQDADSGETNLKIEHYGWTFRPLLSGMADNDGLSGGIGARFYFYDRWGAGGLLKLSENIKDIKPKIFIDRRIDDFVPFLYNTSVGLQGGIDTLGITVNAYF
jgi:hypothetical protein